MFPDIFDTVWLISKNRGFFSKINKDSGENYGVFQQPVFLATKGLENLRGYNLYGG
jgi:hypothetical protein